MTDPTPSGRSNTSAEDLQEALERWQAHTLGPALAERPEHRDEHRTGSGEQPVKALHTPLDSTTTGAGSYLDQLGFPGEYPFTRGVHPAGHRSLRWKLGFYSGFGGPDEANKRLRALAEAGSAYVTLAMDLPSQCGYDPDHLLAAGDVGKVGVSIASVRDVEEVLDGIPLEQVGTGTVGNCIEPMMVGMFDKAIENRGLDPGSVYIRLQNDPLKEYTGRGTWIVPIDAAVELAADVTEFCLMHRRSWVVQYACTTQLRWGGVSASEEIAFGIANFMEYVDRLVARGFAPGEAISRLEGLHMTIDNDLFEEVAKLRATRRLWARLARQRYGIDDPRALGLRLTVFTGAHRLTAQQPLNNVTRTTVHVLAALLGGVERISTPAHDEALALPTEESTRVANLTKIVLLNESNVGHTVDPLGGSYYVEHLTDTLEQSAEAVFRTVENAGGAISAIRQGIYEEAMVRGVQRYQEEVETGARTVVGVNAYRTDDEAPIDLFDPPEGYEQARRERVQQDRARRDARATTTALDALRTVLLRKRDGESINSVPAFTTCVRSMATIGEMSDVMREVYGEAPR